MSGNPERQAAMGIIRRADGALFMQQRRAGQSFAGHWEFPGGKVDEGETPAAALTRELREETGIVVRDAAPFVRRRFSYPGGIFLHFFIVREYEGEPRGCEGQNAEWVRTMPSPLLPMNERICKWLRLPPLYAITAAEVFGTAVMVRRLENALSAGRFSFVQLRDKNLPPVSRGMFVDSVADTCREHGALLCANDDEFLAAETGGLHLSARALARSAKRPSFEWVGASCHSARDIRRAAALDLDFVVLSPVCKTPSHPDTPPLGWEKFAEIAAESPMPVYALGGLTPADLHIAQKNNAYGVAMMRAAWAE